MALPKASLTESAVFSKKRDKFDISSTRVKQGII